MTVIQLLSYPICSHACYLFFSFSHFVKVFDKLKVVLMPLGKESQQNVITKLRECKPFDTIKSSIITSNLTLF